MTDGIHKTQDEVAEKAARQHELAVRPTTWSEYGVCVFDQHTTEEAVVAAGLDWEVEIRPQLQNKKGEPTEVPGLFHTVRKDTEDVLGSVRTRYTAFQNREAFTFFDPILKDGLAVLDSADELYDGKVVWLVAKFQEPIIIAEEELVDMYCLLRTSHDGSTAISVDITPTRLRCSNTLNLALRNSKQSWKVAHTTAMAGKLAEARQVIENLGAYRQEFEATAKQLLEAEMSLKQFENFAAKLLPGETKETQRTKLIEHHGATPTLTDEMRTTRWGALNSVGEFFQHERHFRHADRALKQDFYGTTKATRDRALRLLTVR